MTTKPTIKKAVKTVTSAVNKAKAATVTPKPGTGTFTKTTSSHRSSAPASGTVPKPATTARPTNPFLHSTAVSSNDIIIPKNRRASAGMRSSGTTNRRPK